MSSVEQPTPKQGDGSLGKKPERRSVKSKDEKRRPLSRQEQLNKQDKLGRLSGSRQRRSVRKKIKRGAPRSVESESGTGTFYSS